MIRPPTIFHQQEVVEKLQTQAKQHENFTKERESFYRRDHFYQKAIEKRDVLKRSFLQKQKQLKSVAYFPSSATISLAARGASEAKLDQSKPRRVAVEVFL